MSKIEKFILDKNFSYLQPYFYNNPYALRCELGKSSIATQEQIQASYEKALQIYHILFPHGADALFFHYLVFDCSMLLEGGSYEERDISLCAKEEAARIEFLLSYQKAYRNVVIPDLEKGDLSDDCLLKRNRVVCYADSKGFDFASILKRAVSVDFSGADAYETSLVSFENECIFSVYDDRGCDIVFATKEKYKEFYKKLENDLFDHDLEEMKKRYAT